MPLLPFACRPAYDAHRGLARPCIHPTLLGMELLGDRGWGWAARTRVIQDPAGAIDEVAIGASKWPIWTKRHTPGAQKGR